MKQLLLKSLSLALILLVTSFYSCKKTDSTVTPDTAPQITSITPKNPAPGDVVTVAGTNFGTIANNVLVKIGNTTIAISSVTDTEIKFTVPTTITSGDLAVAINNIAAAIKDPQGVAITITPKTTLTPTFTAMSPTNGKVGDVVTLTGTNFNPQASENKVYFTTTMGGVIVLATIKTASATQLTVEVPASAVTGGVSITANGNNAVVANGFNTTFTVNATSGTGSSTVTYINSLSGALSFSKIATAAKEIGFMTSDRTNRTLYFSDWTILNSTAGQNTVYKVSLTGSSDPVVLTTDTRITNISKITTDANGNVFVLKYEGTGPSTYSIYKISANGTTVTEVIKSFDIPTGSFYFFINAANEICLSPSRGAKIDVTGKLVTGGSQILSLQQKDGGAYMNSSSAYLLQSTANNSQVKTMKFVKWDLSAATISDAGFTPATLFGTDDATYYTSSDNLSYIKYAFDNNNNMYVMTDHSYQSGQINKTWMIRKVAAGGTTSTLLGTFNIKFPTTDLNDYNSALEFVSDAVGNLYFKANQKDIIKITQ